jgi:3-oxoacyl-[acyl-carrier protein] reductase
MIEVLITGASGGIGKALCQAFLAQGHKVFAISRKENEGQCHPNLVWLNYDLSDFDTIALEVMSRSEGRALRILIHNAGHLVRKPFEQIDANDLVLLMNVNLIYPWMLTKSLLPWLKMGVQSHTVYVSSMSGFQGSVKYDGLAAYGASKSAGNAWIEAMSAEFNADQGLYFNALALGAVDTPMLQKAISGVASAVHANTMATYIVGFALEGFKVINGAIIPVRIGNP